MGKNILACVFALSVLAAPAAAQPLPPRDPRTTTPGEPTPAAKAAFLALPESDRKAIQDALGWLGFYNGVIDGAFGKRTIEAVVAWQQTLPATGDGIVTMKQVASLKSAAAKAKAEVGFKVSADPTTSVTFGAPFTLLDKRESVTGGASLTSADGQIGLYLKQTSGDLAALFATMTNAPNRKVTYKYLKPNGFFVVTGEEGDKKFYRRYAASPDDAKSLRGFAFLYPKARAKALDPVALAIANAFEPFPGAAPPLPPTRPAPPPTPSATTSPSDAPEPAKLAAVALIVKPGEAVTTLPVAQCKTPTVEGKPVFLTDGGDGLTRLAGAFGERAAAPSVADGGDDLVALSLALTGDAKTALQVASAAPAPGGGRRIFAALGPVATGAPLFDRWGRLVAFVAPGEAAGRRADVELAGPHAIVSAAGVGDASPPAPASLTASQIAAKMRDAVVGVFCGP